MGTGIIAGNVTGITVIEQSLTPVEVAAGEAATQTFTVPGLKAKDAVLFCPPSTTANVAPAAAYVSADNTLTVQYVNPTDGALTPPAGAYRIVVFRHEGVNGAHAVLT
jgi:hypothetical protein